MTHPQRYDQHDPLLHRISELALSFPGAQRKESHGHPAFYTRKIFLVWGGRVKGNPQAEDLARAILFYPPEEERHRFDDDPRFEVPAYYGPYGWRALDVTAADTDWGEVEDILEMSFRATAPPALVAKLDAESPRSIEPSVAVLAPSEQA